MWRRGRRLAQRYRHGAGKRAHKGRSGHGEDEAAPGLVSIDVADESPLLSEIPATWLFVSSKKKEVQIKPTLTSIFSFTRTQSRPPAAREPRRHSQPAGRHASAVSSEGDLRLCLASPAACASEFKPLARPESARAREPREKERKRKLTVYPSKIIKVTTKTFCHVYIVPAHPRGAG